MRSFSEYNPIAVAVWFFSVTGVAMFCSYPILMAISLSGAVLFFLIRNGFTHGKTHLFFWLLFAVLALANPLVSHNGKTVLFVMNHNPVTLSSTSRELSPRSCRWCCQWRSGPYPFSAASPQR